MLDFFRAYDMTFFQTSNFALERAASSQWQGDSISNFP